MSPPQTPNAAAPAAAPSEPEKPVSESPDTSSSTGSSASAALKYVPVLGGLFDSEPDPMRARVEEADALQRSRTERIRAYNQARQAPAN